jgi:Icc-related predicted phosphoesterase
MGCSSLTFASSARSNTAAEKWELIPPNLDILVTHSPPFKYGDGDKGYDAGDFSLLRAVKVQRPRVHVFGHIHDGWPRHGVVPETDEHTIFVNAAVTDNSALLKHPATVLDI